MKELAVTGAGVVSALGVGRRGFIEAIRAAAYRPGIPARPVEGRDPRGALLEIPGFDAAKYLGDKGLRSLDRLTKILVVATRLALHDAALKRDGVWVASGGAERVGIVVSNAYGSLEAITELDRVATLEDARYINPSRFPLTVSNSAAGYASIWEDLRALNVSVSDGNCGGLDAVACASIFLGDGRAAALVVGGAEAMSEALAVAFERLGALSKGARLGEGAALLTLETVDGARARGAEVHGVVAGYGTAFTAPQRDATLVHACPRSVERAIVAALSDAGMHAGEVDLVVSGVSGVRPFDDAELVGISRVVGQANCVVAPKLLLGETLGAGGALGMLAAVALMGRGGDGIVAPTAPTRAPPLAGAEKHLPSLVLRGSFRAQPRTALVTSLGYYGNASALVLRAQPR